MLAWRYMARFWWTALAPLAALLFAGVACSHSGATIDPQPSGQPLAVSATDNLFAPDAFTVTAGEPYTLTMENAGDAIHNWHILDAKNAGGKDITTPLTSPHKTASATFTIAKPGLYHFQCDVHPDTMKGTLTVRGS